MLTETATNLPDVISQREETVIDEALELEFELDIRVSITSVQVSDRPYSSRCSGGVGCNGC